MRLLVFLGVLIAVCPAPLGALACSVTDDFVRSTTYEMVDQADAIVVATPLREAEGEDGETGVRFGVERALKGVPPAEFDAGWRFIGDTTPGDPFSISGAHAEAFSGSCVRTTFQRGERYVVFLNHIPGEGWRMARHIFWRDAEDYHGPDSLWAEVLDFYIALEAAHPVPEEALTALTEELHRLEGAETTARNRALAEDIRDHLSSLSPWKPTSYLIDVFEALERREEPDFSVRGPEANRERGPRQALTDMIFGVRQPHFDLEAQRLSVLRSLVNGDHPDAAPLFERIVAESATPSRLGMAMRFYSNNGQVRRAYDLIETEGLRRLGGLPDQAARGLAADMFEAMRGRNVRYGEANEAWRDDPHVAMHWPETALSLLWDMRRRFGDIMTEPAIERLRPTDYRQRPEVTLLLAESYDEDVQQWAIREADRLAAQADWLNEDDPAWLPLATLAIGYGDERDAALVQAWCSGDAGRIMTIQSLARWGDPMDTGLLKTFLVTPGQDEEALTQVRLAILSLSLARGRDRLRWSDQDYEAVLASLSGGEVEDYVTEVRPVTCSAG